MSLGNVLNSARSALFAHQAALQVTSHNITNATTEGYSRQRVSLSSAGATRTAAGVMGAGVRLEAVERMRDAWADQSVRRESGMAAGFGLRSDVLGQVEAVFGEPSETGLGATLDAFWSSWSDLSARPNSDSARMLVRQRAEQVVRAVHGAAEGVEQVQTSLRGRLTSSVEQINDIAKRIAEVNHSIQTQGEGANRSGDLADTRDRLLDELSKLGSTRVIERSDGSMGVTVDGAMVVDGGRHQELSVGLSGGRLVVFAGTDVVASPDKGSVIGEIAALYNTDVPAVRASLDQLALGLVLRVNELHTAGFQPGGAPGVAFFADPMDPATFSARDLQLSDEVRTDAGRIVASGVSGSPDDNSIALALSRLRGDATTMPPPPSPEAGTKSFGGFYRDLVTGIAFKVDSAETSVAVHETLAEQAVQRRESTSGVSTDEELIRLTQHQQAYTAASRLVTVVDEMMQSILNMI